MRNKLTLKQRKFVNNYVRLSGNGTKAALDAYDTADPAVAHSIASENLQKPTIQRAIELALERTGLSDEYISELLKETTVAGIGTKATNSDSLRGIEMMLKLKGAFPAVNQKTANLRLDLHQEITSKSINEILKDLQAAQERTQQLINEFSH